MAGKIPNAPADILLVEDSEDDAFFFRRCLAKTGIACEPIRLADGLQATNYLQANHSRAHLVFLDLKMPLVNGFEFLEWFDKQPFKERIQVIVLSGSDNPQEIALTRKLGAIDYIVKPIVAEDLGRRIRSWLAANPAASEPSTL